MAAPSPSAGLLETLLFTQQITAPVFLLVFLGLLLRRTNLITDEFNQTASGLVFKVTLPLLVFLSLLRTDLTMVFAPGLLAYAVLVTLLGFLWLLWHARRLPSVADRGVFVQGAFRGNLGILALALAGNQYGEPGMALTSILMAALVVQYNMLSVIALNMWRETTGTRWLFMLRDMLRNPLIIAVALAIPASLWQLSLPGVVMKTADSLASMTLPLALLCVGAALDLKVLRATSGTALMATAYKLIILPAPMLFGAWLLGYSGMTLGVLFLIFACPTAAASYVMARSMGGNASLAANIIALTTVLGTLTISLGVFGLSLTGLS
ncbi:AEC family transporter [Desulfurispirillum indicum]|uniref:AEC family transporter n=1 Tax=Desulfurispirillum indicum TaxID=936456 RepID=UPI001CFC3886|nr:AEC family transporter [Desulfurispirillum indicum]UCZ57284.1 AEC family transporter [Desulfurispirillum indicum]